MSSLELATSTANARQRGQAVIQIDRHLAPTVAPAANSLRNAHRHSASHQRSQPTGPPDRQRTKSSLR
jgi:hypothetical protein